MRSCRRSLALLVEQIVPWKDEKMTVEAFLWTRLYHFETHLHSQVGHSHKVPFSNN